MGAIWRVLKSGWFLTLLGVIILSLLIWFIGPLISIAGVAPLESVWVRLIIVITLFFLWVVGLLIGMLRRRRANDRMSSELAASADASAPSDASAEEVAALRGRIQEAMTILKKTKLGGGKGGRQYLYQLPWYLLIGPPGAGKTTALLNSGLRFPLADRLGNQAVQGVGGTRNCDWWFTDEAVLIDTAGRFTTQDSDRAADSGAWSGFLGLLKRYRRRQPINGVIIAISLSDLMTLSEPDRRAQATAVRQRLRELDEQLGVRFPIYVMFTKGDLVAGFVEFFDDLGKQEREQVWGHTFPIEESQGDGNVVESFAREFDTLVTRLNERLVERLHQEQDFQRRSMIFGFPQQIASLREPLYDFLREIFQPTRFETRPLLRGFYFASGTQEGNPIDRIMGAMASAFGIGRQAVTGFSGSGRSYFLTRLLRNVVFAEASVVSTNRKEERRRRWRQRFAYGFCAIALLGIGTVWTVSYFRNAGLIDDAERRVALYNAQVEGVELSQVTDPDLTPVLSALATLRDMPGGYTRQDESVPLLSGFGLYQGDKIGAQAIVAYRRALNDLFLPRVLLGLEQVLINNLDDPETLYPALRVYLMLGNQGPMDGEIVRVFLSETWQRQYPGLGMTETRADLVSHLDAMVDMARLGDVPLNGELIDRARTVLNEVPLAERAYAAIRQAPDARQLTPWRPIDAGGPATNRVFERASGEALSTGIEGLYTHDGFYTYFLPTMIDTANQVAEESWVLGSDARSDLSDQQLALLERDVMQLYLNDYVTVWERMLADLRIIGFTSLNHAVGVLNTMSGPNSPLRNLLVSAAEQTQLSVQPAYLSDPASAAGQVLSGGGASFLGQFAAFEARRRLGYTSQAVIGMAAGSGGLDSIAATATGGEGGSDLPPLGLYVDERFRGLHEFVASGGGGPSPLDDLVSRLADVRTELNSVADAAQYGGGSVGELVTGGGGGALSGLQLDAAQLPSPVGGWVAEVAGNANTALVGGASNRLADAWNADVAELCVRATNNRYPIVRSASSDVTLDDFARLFGPSGRIQTFFDDNLARVVDTSGRTWQWRNVEGVDLGIPSHVLTQFQRANDIQEAFWPDGGGGTPRVSFELTPVSLDRTANQVLLDIDGETITYSHGPPRASRITWPGNAGRARIAFSPQIAGASSLTREGGWAFFRLLDTASISASGASDRFNVSFNVGDRSATFRLQAGSVNNPFNLPALSSFRCPTFQ